MAIRFANMVLSSASTVCLILWAYLFAQHGWATHYLFLLALATILWAARQLPIATRCNAALLLCSLIFTCYLAEVVLALKPWSFIRTPWVSGFGENESMTRAQATIATKHQIEFDRRNKFAVVSDLRTEGLDAWPLFPSTAAYKEYPTNTIDPSIVINGVGIMPLGGIADKVTVHCNENGTYTIYTTDEYGFPNPKGLWDLPHIDIAAVGDSFVNGACVSSDTNFVALVRRKYPKTLNVGRDGNGPLSDLATIKEFLPLVKPKVVLWFYFEGNDLSEDLPLEKRNTILRNYLKRDFRQGLPDQQVAVDRALMDQINTIQRSQLLMSRLRRILHQNLNPATALENLERIAKFTNLRGAIISAVHRTRPSGWVLVEQTHAPQDDIEIFSQALVEGKQSAQAWGGMMVFVYLPQWERYSNAKYANKDRERVLALVRSLNIPIIDLQAVFDAHRDPLSLFPFREKGHYTEEGNQLVADEILRFVDRHPFGNTAHRLVRKGA